MRSKGQISLNFDYHHVNSKIFIPNFVCVLTNKILITYWTEFWFCCWGHDPGVRLGGVWWSKTLARGFAMAPNRLRILVFNLIFGPVLSICNNRCTVKPVLSGLSQIYKKKVLKLCGSSMQVESIAECSPWTIQYFWPALSANWSWRAIFGLFESDRLRQILLYME